MLFYINAFYFFVFITVTEFSHRDPELDNVQGVKDLGALSPTGNIFLKLFFSRFKDLCRRGGIKDVGVQVVDDLKETASSRVNRVYAHVNTQRPRQHT